MHIVGVQAHGQLANSYAPSKRKDGHIAANFTVTVCPQYDFYPICWQTFLANISAEIHFPKEKVFINCAGERLEYNFSKFTDKHAKIELKTIDKVEAQQFTREEREAIEQELAQQPPIIQLNIPPNELGEPPPAKEILALS